MSRRESVSPKMLSDIPLWLVSSLIFFMVTGWLGWSAYLDFNRHIANEYYRLELGVRHRASATQSIIRSAELLLTHLEDDVSDVLVTRKHDVSAVLRDHIKQLPEVRAALIADESGHIIGSTDPKVIGFDASERNYFKSHKSRSSDTHNKSHNLFISPPFN